MDGKSIFDSAVELYARTRPTYPDAVYREIFEFARLSAGELAVEVGIGTGKATQPFVDAGLRIVAYEPAPNLAAYARAALGTVEVIESPFEDCALADGSAAIVYSATAFHWLEPSRGYGAAMRVLRPGGTLALFWNRPGLGDMNDPMHVEIQKAYDRWRPGESKPPLFDANRYKKRRDAIEEHGFELREYKIFEAKRYMSADAYVELLGTYSDNIALPSEQREGLFGDVHAAIVKHGGTVTIHDTVDLHLARKPLEGRYYE